MKEGMSGEEESFPSETGIVSTQIVERTYNKNKEQV
jgi:hypothetical protein